LSQPSFRENILKGLPLIRIEKEEEEMHVSIQLIQVAWNPNFFIIARIKDHSILSKAFFISIFRNIKPPIHFLFLKECRSS
jgi:hypothetical protein